MPVHILRCHDEENAPSGAHVYQCEEHPDIAVWLVPWRPDEPPMRCGTCQEPLADRGLVKPGTHN